VTSHQPLDQVPVFLFVVLFVLISLACYEIGYRFGIWSGRGQAPGEEGPTGLIVGSILALMAFLLGITVGMASDRFDSRRALVLQETNALGTTYLRAGYLSDPASSESQALIREYVPLRIFTSDRAEFDANMQRSEEIQAELWAIAEDVARTEGNDVVALYIESLNEVIDLHTTRFVARIYSRVPPTVVWLLVAGVFLSLGLVGYNAGLHRRRSPIIGIVLVVSLGAVIWLVVDLDRPTEGLIQTNQQPLIDLQEKLEPTP
jgi:hypothetical protein